MINKNKTEIKIMEKRVELINKFKRIKSKYSKLEIKMYVIR